MSEPREPLSPAAQGLLNDYVQPSMTQAQRVALRGRVMEAASAGVVPELASSAVATAGKGGVVLQVILGGAIATLGAFFVGQGWPSPDAPAPAPAASPSVEPLEASPELEPEAEPEPEPEQAVAAPVPAQPVDAPPEPEPAPPKTKAKKASAAAPAPSSSAEEARLLAKAQMALREGDYRGALSVVNEHERRFPKGTMVEAREAARAVAECKLDPAHGATIRDRFDRRFGKSAYTRRVANACPEAAG